MRREKIRAVIGGTSLMQSTLFAEWKDITRETPYGAVAVKTEGRHFFVQRHGIPPLPPHRINYRGYIWALNALKVKEIIAVNSVGSLKPGLKPGSFVIPHDFLSFWDVPTFWDDEMKFTVPEMDEELRGRLSKACEDIGMERPASGIYVQTRGPRLETRAEVGVLKKMGDVVGMTMASEATLCIEAGIPYASICSVDNYCNGIVGRRLTMEEIGRTGLKSLGAIETLLKKLCEIK
ncbi:MAG TPA: MTAP family purine nucleoside phosphorylase [Syntrophorhabdaceae bacterium]